MENRNEIKFFLKELEKQNRLFISSESENGFLIGKLGTNFMARISFKNSFIYTEILTVIPNEEQTEKGFYFGFNKNLFITRNRKTKNESGQFFTDLNSILKYVSSAYLNV